MVVPGAYRRGVISPDSVTWHLPSLSQDMSRMTGALASLWAVKRLHGREGVATVAEDHLFWNIVFVNICYFR